MKIRKLILASYWLQQSTNLSAFWSLIISASPRPYSQQGLGRYFYCLVDILSPTLSDFRLAHIIIWRDLALFHSLSPPLHSCHFPLMIARVSELATVVAGFPLASPTFPRLPPHFYHAFPSLGRVYPLNTRSCWCRVSCPELLAACKRHLVFAEMLSCAEL